MSPAEQGAAAAITDLYERTAASWSAARGEQLIEGEWLDRLTRALPPGASILDLGCGNGRPIAAALIDRGFAVTGVDAAPSLIRQAAAALPAGEWIVGDMRALALGRRFDAILAWHSFFHLSAADQRGMFARFAAHAATGAPLMFTSGYVAGIAMGEWQGEPLFHASLSPDEYRALFAASGFMIEDYWPGEPIGEGPTVWLARKR